MSTVEARRHNPRVSLHETAYINFGSGNRGVIVNVSEGGLRFKTATPLVPADSVRFWLTFSRRAEGIADLAWSDESRTTGGLRFKEVPEEIRQQIREWIDRGESEPVERHPIPPINADPDTEAHLSLPSETPRVAESEPAFVSRVQIADDAEPAVSRGPQQTATLLIDEEFEPLASEPAVVASSETEPALTGHEPLLSPRANVIGKENTLSMFSAENQTARSHRFAVAVLVLLIALSLAAGATAYYYPSEARDAMSRIQAKVAQFINPARKRSASNVEPASIGGVSGFDASPERTNPAPDVASGTKNASARPESSSTGNQPSNDDKHANAAAWSDDATSTKANAAAELQLAQKYLADDSNPDQKAKAVQLLWLATEKGNVDAEIQLADLYARGEGVPKSCVQARILLKVAASANPALAQPKLSELDQSGCS